MASCSSMYFCIGVSLPEDLVTANIHRTLSGSFRGVLDRGLQRREGIGAERLTASWVGPWGLEPVSGSPEGNGKGRSSFWKVYDTGVLDCLEDERWMPGRECPVAAFQSSSVGRKVQSRIREKHPWSLQPMGSHFLGRFWTERRGGKRQALSKGHPSSRFVS